MKRAEWYAELIIHPPSSLSASLFGVKEGEKSRAEAEAEAELKRKEEEAKRKKAEARERKRQQEIEAARRGMPATASHSPTHPLSLTHPLSCRGGRGAEAEREWGVFLG